MSQPTAQALSRVAEEEELILTEEEMELLLFTKEEEEFMVVPTLQDSPIRLEDLLSEETFNGLMVDTLQNPSGVFVVDVEQTSGNRNSIGKNGICNNGDGIGNGNAQVQNFVQYNSSGSQNQQQYHYYQQQQFPYATSDNNLSTAKSNGSVIVQPDSGSGQFLQQAASTAAQFSQQQRQYSELADPTANWVAQTTDVTLLERLVSVDDILDIVPASADTSSVLDQSDYQQHITVLASGVQQSGSPVLDKNQILEEIYREAEEISSRNGSPAVFSPTADSGNSNHGSLIQSDMGDLYERISNSSSSASISIDTNQSIASSFSYHPPQKIAFDHSFGFEASGKKQQRKSTKSKQDDLKIVIKKSTVVSADGNQKAPKREAAKQKKRHQNREAALRYRLKKRAERTATGDELNSLIERNEHLKTQKSNLASEIAYLKGLLSEVHKRNQTRS